MGLTTELANDLYNIHKLQLADIEQLKIILTDFFAATFAGYIHNCDFNEKVENVIYKQVGLKESYVFMQNRKFPARAAAFMNAIYCHGAELDDGNKKAAGHIGTHVIPATFALADKLGSSNNDVLTALATGYEAYIRISSAAQPGLIERGFHSTGIAGTLACAAACARLYHLNATGIENAIALATTMTGGLLSYGDSRPAIKPLNPGKAAENGVFAAMLANEGVQGPTEALEGPNGWFHAVTEEVHAEYLNNSDHLLLHDCYFKLYPSCRHTHCTIDAAVSLHKRINPGEIERVNVHIYPNAIKLAGIRFPQDQEEAKFSIQYTMAKALFDGYYGIDNMNPIGLSDDIHELIERIYLIEDKSLEDRVNGIRGSRVELLTKGGRVLEETVLIPKGDPENPLSREEITDKLRDCAKGQADENTLSNLIHSIDQIDGQERFINPMALTGGAI